MDPAKIGAVLVVIASNAGEGLHKQLWEGVVSLVRRPFRREAATHGDAATAALARSGEAELAALRQDPGDQHKARALAEVLLARSDADDEFQRALEGWWERAEPIRAKILYVMNISGIQGEPEEQGQDSETVPIYLGDSMPEPAGPLSFPSGLSGDYSGGSVIAPATDRQPSETVATNDQLRVWNQRRPINYPKQIEMTGGFSAPLLAGFSLTTLALLVIGKDHPWLSEWAIPLFAIAAVLLVYAVQFSTMVLRYAATPSQRLDYNPEAASNSNILHTVRKWQWEEMELQAKYAVRARQCYNFGLLAFLAGLGLILVPNPTWPWPWGRFVGIAVVSASLIIEVLWIKSDGQNPKWLLPTSDPKTPDDLPREGAEYLFARDESDAIARNLDR